MSMLEPLVRGVRAQQVETRYQESVSADAKAIVDMIAEATVAIAHALLIVAEAVEHHD